MIEVEVAYALPYEQKIIVLHVAEGSSVYEVVIQSRIVDVFPQIDVENDPVGIFGKTIRNPKETIIKTGQRIEIYRPLTADPKDARAKRAAKAKAQRDAKG